MAVALTNPRKEAFVFTLYHSVYCAGGATCLCQKDNVLRSTAGGLRYEDIVSPVGVFLESGETRTFHDAVLSIQQIAAAVAKGILKQVVVAEAAPVVELSTGATTSKIKLIHSGSPVPVEKQAKVKTEKLA